MAELEANGHADSPAINPWVVAVAVMSATFLEVLDTTVVNVSLPHIAGNLSATIEEATWVLTSYLVANAIILPMTGWLAGYFGRKRLLMAAVAGFTIASFLCGLAPSMPLLVFFRVIQGAAGGNLQPLTQAVLWETFPVEKRGKAMGFLGLGFVTAPLLGPLLGGWITENYSWRWIFYINFPIGCLSLLLLYRYVFDPPYIRKISRKIDYWGIGLLVLGIGAVQILLDMGQKEDWFASDAITTLALVALASLVVFAFYELRAPNPVVQLRVFRLSTYALGVVLIVVIGFVLYGSMVLLPIMLQTLMGYPAVEAGIATAPRGLGSAIAMPIAGVLTAKYDPRKLLAGGLLAGAGALEAFARLDLSAGYWDVFWPQVVQGFTLAFVFVPLMTIAMAPISKEATGNATSIFSLMRNLGASVGIASVATLHSRFQQVHIHDLGAHVTPYELQATLRWEGMRALGMAGGLDPVTAGQRSSAALFGMVQRQASMLSFLDLYHLLALLFLLATPLPFLMKKPGKSAEGRPGVE